MSYSTSNRGGGGGGGFGSFPYRSSHQRGSDHPGSGSSSGGGNNNRRNNGGRGNGSRSSKTSKYLKRKERGGPLLYTAFLSVPASKRSAIVGRHAGKVIKDICQRTNCVIDVPRNSSSSRVKIRASCEEFLLCGCWEVSLIIQEDVEYQLNIQLQQRRQQHTSNMGGATMNNACSSSTSATARTIVLRGIMRYLSPTIPTTSRSNINIASSGDEDSSLIQRFHCSSCGLFLEDMQSIVIAANTNEDAEETCCTSSLADVYSSSSTTSTSTTTSSSHAMSCYVISSYLLDEDEMTMLVDNERFCDPDIKALAFVTRQEDDQELPSLVLNNGKASSSSSSSSNRCLTLLFIYGSPQDKTWNLYHNIHENVRKLEEKDEEEVKVKQSICST
jgi:KH domain.